ncbi:MAG: hypothetical protein ACJ8KU_09590 [Chthoniobacterales bacterium]
MDEFSYLSVLLSVVIGLAVTEILQGFRGRIVSAARVRSYWPARVWSVTLLLVCAQTWWAMFGLRSRHTWTFDEFLVLLTQVIVLYLVCGLLYPDFAGTGEIDLRAHYFAQRRRFFSFVVIAALTSIARDMILYHSLPNPRNLTYHIVFVVTSIIAIITANEWYHKALALFMACAFVNYITTLFVRLQ